MRNIIRRWAFREERALQQQFHSKDVWTRFRGLRRSERNEAKMFLLAMVPTLAAAPFVPKWSDASSWGKAVWVVTAVWAVIVLAVGLFFLLRALGRSMKNPKG